MLFFWVFWKNLIIFRDQQSSIDHNIKISVPLINLKYVHKKNPLKICHEDDCIPNKNFTRSLKLILLTNKRIQINEKALKFN